jgi:hypothetical protein
VLPVLIQALTGAALAVEPVMGVDWVPFGRADLVAVEDEWTSGTGVGEFDGLLRPALTPYAGVGLGKTTVLVGLGVALARTTTWTAESRSSVSAGGFRPSVDVQRDFGVGSERIQPWLGAGLYGIWPIARNVDQADTNEEADAADEGATATKFRIAGAGLRAGAGADVVVTEGFELGFRAHLVGHNGWSLTEAQLGWSTLIWAEAGLRLQVWWP